MNPLYIKCIFDLYYIYYKNIVILLFIFVLDLYVCAQLSLIYTLLNVECLFAPLLLLQC